VVWLLSALVSFSPLIAVLANNHNLLGLKFSWANSCSKLQALTAILRKPGVKKKPFLVRFISTWQTFFFLNIVISMGTMKCYGCKEVHSFTCSYSVLVYCLTRCVPWTMFSCVLATCTQTHLRLCSFPQAWQVGTHCFTKDCFRLVGISTIVQSCLLCLPTQRPLPARAAAPVDHRGLNLAFNTLFGHFFTGKGLDLVRVFYSLLPQRQRWVERQVGMLLRGNGIVGTGRKKYFDVLVAAAACCAEYVSSKCPSISAERAGRVCHRRNVWRPRRGHRDCRHCEAWHHSSKHYASLRYG